MNCELSGRFYGIEFNSLFKLSFNPTKVFNLVSCSAFECLVNFFGVLLELIWNIGFEHPGARV
jgi:hypothetical protein